MTGAAELPEHERGHLKDLLATCPHVTVLAQHVHALAELVTTRRGNDLGDWMSAVEASDLPALHAFIRGLRKDQPAVVAGLSMPDSNGRIEGTNTKVKLLKRQMYGARASLCCDSGFCSADPLAPPLLYQSRSSDSPDARHCTTPRMMANEWVGLTDG